MVVGGNLAGARKVGIGGARGSIAAEHSGIGPGMVGAWASRGYRSTTCCPSSWRQRGRTARACWSRRRAPARPRGCRARCSTPEPSTGCDRRAPAAPARGPARRGADRERARQSTWAARSGYQVRFDRKVGPTTRIELVTEGVLTRRLLGDPELRGVGCVVDRRVPRAPPRRRPRAGTRRAPARPPPRARADRDVGDARRRAGRGLPRRRADRAQSRAARFRSRSSTPRSPTIARSASQVAAAVRRARAGRPRRRRARVPARRRRDPAVCRGSRGRARTFDLAVLTAPRRPDRGRPGRGRAPGRAPQGDPRDERRGDLR